MGCFKVKKLHFLAALLYFSCFISPLAAQKQGSQWCFGDSAGIDWTDPNDPQFYVSASRYRGSCASIADTVGNLLFYCANIEGDGFICPNLQFNYIYNKNHDIMEDGACLPGQAWYNEHTIIQAPGNDSLYYVFSVDNVFSISYNLIDINANGGLGKVVERDHQLIAFPEGNHFSWSITAVKHGNGRDWWIIAKSGGASVQLGLIPLQFYEFLVTPLGVFTTFIPLNDIYKSEVSQLLFNHQGDKFYNVASEGELKEYSFNRCNGDILIDRIIDTSTFVIYNEDSIYTRAYLFSDMANYAAGMAYATEGLADSNLIEQNYEGTIIGDIMDLNVAMNEGDSLAALSIIQNLPHGDEMLDNIITVTEIQLGHDVLTHNDSIALENIANINVKDGGPAVVTARNRLNKYVDETELLGTPKKTSKQSTIETFWASIYPNPSVGEMIIKTNAEELLSIHIYDAIGNLVYNNAKVENQTIINFSSFTNGCYTVNINNSNNIVKRFKWVLIK